MEQKFCKQRLSERHKIDVLVPARTVGREVHRIAVKQLDFGMVHASSREKAPKIMESPAAEGAEAIVLGCAERSLGIKQEHTALPIFDTTQIHAWAAIDRALSEKIRHEGLPDVNLQAPA